MTDQVDFRNLVARLGWKCPECGTVYAPSVTQCDKAHAPPQAVAQPGAGDGEAPGANGASGNSGAGANGGLRKGFSSRVLDTDYTKDTAFQAFWTYYPNHRDKARAYKEWRKQLAQVAQEERHALAQRIIAGAKAYRDDPNRDPSKTKYAEGWLSGRRWEDELGTIAAPSLASVKTQDQVEAEWAKQRAEDDARIAKIRDEDSA